MTTKVATSIAVLLTALSAVNCQWRSLGDIRFKQISTSPNYIWAVNDDGGAYKCNRPCTDKKWTLQGHPLHQISAGEEEVWGVNENTKAVWKGPVDGSARWHQVSGELDHVSASGNGYIWGVGYAGQTKICKKPCNGDWIDLPGLKAVEVDGGNAYVYALDENSRLTGLAVNAGGPGWRFIPGVAEKFAHITGSGKGDVFVTTEDDKLYRCKKPCVSEWELMATDKAQCDATFDSIVCLDSEGMPYELMTS